MQSIYRLSRYILPAAFVGYSVVANFAFLTESESPTIVMDSSFLRGGPTAQLDGLYKQALPHREPSIGLLGAARYLTIGEGRKGVVTADDGWLFTSEETLIAEPEVLQSASAQIVDVRDALAEQGVRLLILPVPAKIDVYRDQADQAALSDAMAGQYAAFLADMRRADVDIVDSRTALIARSADDLAYFRTDTHWTREGAAAAAEAVSESGLIAAGTTGFSAESDAEKAFTGDLVSFVTTADLAPAVGLQQEAVTPFRAEAAADGALTDLFENSAADIVLIGTSYSANPDWSFSESLKVALSRDVLNYAEEGRGPARPMLSYLASDDLRDAPPQTVIWEFPIRYLSDPSIWDVTDTTGDESAT